MSKFKGGIIILFLLAGFVCPEQASAMKGAVVKVDVCRPGNSIFKTSTGWYVNARHLSGVMMPEGERISGNLKKYGIQLITGQGGKQGKYYILSIQTNRIDAVNAFCRVGI